jgi:polyhydroxyalkanoate synthase
MKRFTNLLGLWSREKPKVGSTPSDVVHAENKWRLLRYRSESRKFATPVLMVPSLINRHYVLDLMPGKSFAQGMLAAGHDVYCIDWGTPGPEDRYVTFDEVVHGIIGRAVRACARATDRGQVHVLGYCMGGTLAAIHGARSSEKFASLTAIAAPVRFDDGGLLSAWTRSSSFDVNALVDANGLVPWQLLQSAFHLLRPTLSLSKAVSLLDRAWNDEFLDGFLALETWGNDNVSLPGEFYRTYVNELIRKDGLLHKTLGDLQKLTCPLNVVSFEHDNIVPAMSATALLEMAGSKDTQHLHLPGGHVGAVVSKHAAKTLWPQLSAFWAARDVKGKRGGLKAVSGEVRG